MGRYFNENQMPSTWSEDLNRQVQMITQVLIDKKMKEQQRKQEMADAMELYKYQQGFKPPSKWEPTTQEEAIGYERSKQDMKPTPKWQPTTRDEALEYEKAKAGGPQVSITQSPWGISEVEDARGILGRSSQDWKKVMPEGSMKRSGGFMGSGIGPSFGFGTGYEPATPEATSSIEALKTMAKGRLTGPKTTRIEKIGKFGGATIAEADLPDASLYEEGTVITDDTTGAQYKIVNGKWAVM